MTENEVREDLKFKNKLLMFENGKCILFFNKLNEDLHGKTWDVYGKKLGTDDELCLFHWKDRWLK